MTQRKLFIVCVAAFALIMSSSCSKQIQPPQQASTSECNSEPIEIPNRRTALIWLQSIRNKLQVEDPAQVAKAVRSLSSFNSVIAITSYKAVQTCRNLMPKIYPGFCDKSSDLKTELSLFSACESMYKSVDSSEAKAAMDELLKLQCAVQ